MSFLRWFKHQSERGQALAEYMPTLAGFLSLGTIALILLGGGVQRSYCKVVDAFGDRPDVCIDEGDEGDVGTPGDDVGDTDDGTDDTLAACVITLSSAPGTDPTEWNTPWDGEPDVLTVEVNELPTDGDVTWSLKLRFPTDPDSVDTEIDSGAFTTTGTYMINVPYPPEGEWGPASADGYGTYESHATLHIADPCPDVGWDRWYKAAWTADLAIDIEHDVSPVTFDGETLTYDIVVTNNGPNNAEVYQGQGVVVNFPAPPGVTVLSATPSQGSCDTTIACDLGDLPYQASATITVVTTVNDVGACSLDGFSDVSAPRPPDPDLSNNQDSTFPWCEVVCQTMINSLTLIDADTGEELGQLTDGTVINSDDRISVRADVSGDVGSVTFKVTKEGACYHYNKTENQAPYAIAGDDSGVYNAWNPGPGTYTLTVRPYSGSMGTGETCSMQTVSITIAEGGGGGPGGDDGDENYDEDDTTDSFDAECPPSHPVKLFEWDRFAKPDDYTYALKYGSPTREKYEADFTLDEDVDAVLVLRSMVGHPEVGCPGASHPFCNKPNQTNEHWNVYIDDDFKSYVPDSQVFDHTVLIAPDVALGTVPAGTHTVLLKHAGNPPPTNSSGPSVGAKVAFCVANP